MTRIARTVGGTIAAGAAAIALAVLPAVSASAATTGTNGTATLSATGPATVVTDGNGVLNGVGTGTVTLTGTNFDGNAGGLGFGVYAVYGPKESDYFTNSGWYGSAQWIPKSSFTTGGKFTTTLTVSKSYTADPHHTGDAAAKVDCAYDATKTKAANAALGKYKCYLQTFSAHGVQNSTPTRDEVTIPVNW